MTDILKKTDIAVTASLVDTNARADFRAFGQPLGSSTSPTIGRLEVIGFGDAIEITAKDAPGLMVEFHIKGLVGVANKMMTLAAAGRLSEMDAELTAAQKIDSLLAVLDTLLVPHFDEFGTVNPNSAGEITGRMSNGDTVLKGSFLANLERARATAARVKESV